MTASGGDSLRLTIDGVDVEVPPDTTVLQAAERAGVVVPHYCYHPGIPTRPAQCRMCLVEIEGQPKLQPSCVMPAAEGMVVRTESDAAREARRSVIEFLLINHPLDCPICDAAGQCMLQDYAHETGQLRSRYADEKLVLGRDRVANDILYFGDRCIVCTRCVRFMRDVARDDALIVAQRGHKAYIDTFPGTVLDHPFRGNIVDVCPVGALVHEDYLFKARAWDLDSTPGVCSGCSTGCNLEIGVKENQVVRVKPRYNPDVNAYWMCDHGRRHMVMGNRGPRVTVPLIRRNGQLEPASWLEAVEWVAERLDRAAGTGASVVSPRVACEDLYFLRRLLGQLEMDDGAYRLERGDESVLEGFPKLALRAERAPNGSGAELFGFAEGSGLPEVGNGDTLLVLGDRLTDAPEGYGSEAGLFVAFATHHSRGLEVASAVLPVTLFLEMAGTFVNYEGRLQRFHQAVRPPGVARPAWMVLSRILERLGAGVAVSTITEAFTAMAQEMVPMAEIEWEELGLRGRQLAAWGRPTVTAE